MFQKSSGGMLARVLEAVGAFCLVVLMVTVFVDVVGRNVFNKPLPWGTEALEIVLAAMIFLIYPVLAAGSGHITVDLIRMHPTVQKVQRVLGALMGMALFALIAWCLVRQARRAAEYGEATALLHVPIAWILGTMAVLGACASIGFVVAMLRALRTNDTRNSVEREMEAL